VFIIDDAVIADESQLADVKVFVVGRNSNKAHVSFAFAGNSCPWESYHKMDRRLEWQ
jgi:hypothetical protein